MNENIPDYKDIQIEEDEDIDDIHQQVDQMGIQEIPSYGSDENIELPDDYSVAGHKYDIEPDRNNPWDGRHVVNSNTLRKDNFRRILVIDSNRNWSSMPQFSNLADGNRLTYTAEMQMTRGNEERGGFDRRMQRSVLKREDVDVKQSQTLNNLNRNEKKGMLSFLRRKK